MRLALDTNRSIDLCRGDAPVVETVETADEVWIPFIVLGELRTGFAVGTQGPRNEAVLRRFLLNLASMFFMPTNRPPIIMRLCTGNCENREGPSLPTTYGLRPWFFSIRSRCTIGMPTSTHFRNSRASRIMEKLHTPRF